MDSTAEVKISENVLSLLGTLLPPQQGISVIAAVAVRWLPDQYYVILCILGTLASLAVSY